MLFYNIFMNFQYTLSLGVIILMIENNNSFNYILFSIDILYNTPNMILYIKVLVLYLLLLLIAVTWILFVTYQWLYYHNMLSLGSIVTVNASLTEWEQVVYVRIRNIPLNCWYCVPNNHRVLRGFSHIRLYIMYHWSQHTAYTSWNVG